jgi:hypothetical protein
VTSLFQDAFAEFPLRNWTIEPIPDQSNKLRVVIEGKINTIELEVMEKGCKLINPVVDFEGISKTVFTPCLLFKVRRIWPSKQRI